MTELLIFKPKESMYCVPHVEFNDKLQQQLELLERILHRDDFYKVVDFTKKLNSKADNSVGAAERLLRMLSALKRKYINISSRIALRNFSNVVRKLVTIKKNNPRLIFCEDYRQEIRFLKNNFRHFDDEDNINLNDHVTMSFNFNIIKNEFKNKFKRKYRICTL